jgi:hypothetical protein
MIDKLEKFLSLKEDVMNNLANLQELVLECEEKEILRDSNELYNQLETLMENTKSISDTINLEMIIIRGKEIEKQLDVILAERGTSSIELTWPVMPPSL